MSASSRSWGRDDYDEEPARWDNPEYDAAAGGSDSDEDPDPMLDKDAAGREFLNCITELYCISTLSAEQLCVLCFWAGKAGAVGGVHLFWQGARLRVYQLPEAHRQNIRAGRYQIFVVYCGNDWKEARSD